MFLLCSFIGNLGVAGRIGLKPAGVAPRPGKTGASAGQVLGAITFFYENSGIPSLVGGVRTTALISEIPVIARSPFAFLCVLCV